MTTAACPKCGFERKGAADACARCGLVFANWKPELGPPPVQLDAGGEALWSQAEGAWTDEERHEAFVRHCSGAGLLAAAGRRYRERLDRNPGDQIAARMQDRILGLATIGFTVQRAAPRPQPVTRKGWFWLVVGACAAIGVFGAMFLAR